MSKFILRDYQQQASDIAVDFFRSKAKGNGIIVAPTGSGKSLLIADIARQLNGSVIVLQPSKEILEQNLMNIAVPQLILDITIKLHLELPCIFHQMLDT